MDWHIVTSSKGGVGKTLISLMLTAYHCIHNDTLIVDLNGMNADVSRLLSPEGDSFREMEDYLYLKLSLDRTKPSDDRFFHFERVGGLSGVRVGYVNSWPNDPFKTMNAQTFASFLVELKKKIEKELYNKFGYSIQTVIIDTNYHFCNLFPERREDYLAPFNSQNDNFFIWFIWVYRQFADLMEMAKISAHNIAPRTVKERAQMMEEKLGKNHPWGNPFVHIFSPVFIGEMLTKNQSFFKKTLPSWLTLEDSNTLTISPLQQLLSFIGEGKVDRVVTFDDLFQKLKKARGEIVTKEKIADANELFIKMLEVYVKGVTACPRNLIPLHLYQKDLLGYTEADYQGLLLNQVYNKMKIYRNSFEIAYHALRSKKPR